MAWWPLSASFGFSSGPLWIGEGIQPLIFNSCRNVLKDETNAYSQPSQTGTRVEFKKIYCVSVLISLWYNLKVYVLCVFFHDLKTVHIKAQNVVDFPDDIHIFVISAFDKLEVAFLFSPCTVCFLKLSSLSCEFFHWFRLPWELYTYNNERLS